MDKPSICLWHCSARTASSSFVHRLIWRELDILVKQRRLARNDRLRKGIMNWNHLKPSAAVYSESGKDLRFMPDH